VEGLGEGALTKEKGAENMSADADGNFSQQVDPLPGLRRGR